MNPTVMKMLTDAHMRELNRQVVEQRFGNQKRSRGDWVTLPLALATLLIFSIIIAGWIA